MSIKQKQN